MFDLSHHGSVSVSCEGNISIPKLSQVLNQNQEHKDFLIMHMIPGMSEVLTKMLKKLKIFLPCYPTHRKL